MKILTTILNLAFLSVVILSAISCSNDDDGTPAEDPQNIVEIALATQELSTLVAALQSADGDLGNVLSGDGPFTVFAPTNQAFNNFLADNNFASLNDVPSDLLSSILLNHVVAGTNLSTGLSTGYITSSSNAGVLGGPLSLFINTSNGVEINGISTVTTADIEATNGVIHLVDAVIGLPTIVDHVLANDDLSELVGALTANGNTTFTDLLSDDSVNFTVFAPSNSAFASFTNPNNNEIDNILSNHVIVGVAEASGSIGSRYYGTAALNIDGDNISIYVNNQNGVVLNGSSMVTVSDIFTTNGLIHVVDEVIDLPTVVTFATADPTFAPLASALTDGTPATDFVALLSGDGPFTVFTPTDTAFQNLLDSNPAWDMVTDIDEGLLTSVLQHHVANGNVRAEDLTNGISITTLEGDDITINFPGPLVTDGSGNTDIGIIEIDVQANNGVIHVLNKVMLPDTNN
jgi:uncharacterized surface protein with fasciclin (FAS1) repeats